MQTSLQGFAHAHVFLPNLNDMAHILSMQSKVIKFGLVSAQDLVEP
jgi:hypothetical protein